MFTLESAEAMIPRVRDELVAMQGLKKEIDQLRGELSGVATRAVGNGHVTDEAKVGEQRRRAEALVEQLNDRLARVNGWGVEIKGIDEGLADFPSDRDGRVVYLCWRLGEDRIAWWHEVDSGFAGRQPL
jgi:hypothetical protein